MSEALLEKLQTIESMLALQDTRLWSTKEIADHANVSERTARDHIVLQPWFPKPIRPTGPSGDRRWFADEVREAYRLNRGKLS